ncbi:hybrid sensor histidine kinase/response regulator [Pelagicoccus mobilis]|uniref:histidine kinase n=1 Tax=Pelagicoccus mobilis TaxID=415221 RepID=A0A934S3S7_9BACT|nr:hybrid sensor histidine kinase/response regulator [Pelagicoccus mobilis]MBK1878874.1 response regulator [Pelagicoccus mobilis]
MESSPLKTALLLATSLASLLCSYLAASEDQALLNLDPARDYENLPFRKLEFFEQAAVGRIHALTQGPNGFIWIGTQHGLYRYDGHRIRKFQHAPLKNNSLAHDTVWSLHLDQKNRLWVGTGHGISLYQPETESFLNFLNPETSNLPLGFSRINAISSSEANAIFASSETGFVYTFDEANQTFSPINQETLGLIKSMYIESAEHIWLGVSNAVHRLELATGAATTFSAGLGSPDGISNNYITSICRQDNGQLWLGTTNRGILQFDANGHSTQPTALAATTSEFVNQIALAPDGRLWIASNSGITIYDTVTNALTKHTSDSLGSPHLPQSGINTMWADHQGNLWIGSNFDGIGVSVRFKNFKSLPIHLTRPELSPNSPVAAILEDHEGNLWVGHKNEGITMYPSNGDTPHTFNPDPDDPTAITDQPILRIFQDSQHNIWVGTYRAGLFRYRPESQNFERFLHDPQDPYSIPGHDIRDFAEDAQGNLWIATHETGVARLDLSTLQFKTYRKAQADEHGIQIKNDWVNAVLVDRQDQLWIGSPTGITLLSSDRKSATHYKHDPDQDDSLSHSLVTDILEDSNGAIWIATANGLNRFAPSEQSFERFLVEDGLPHKSVCSIVDAANGDLWISTLDGLAKLNHDTQSISSYYTSDGLKGNDFFENSAIRGKDGTLYFGQNKGLTLFSPDEIHDYTQIPDVFITGIRIFNQSLELEPPEGGYKLPTLDRSILMTSELKLSHEQNAITFEYIAIDYLDPNQNEYAYILEGQDDQWTHVQAQFEATYTNLSPGNYVFKVIASNNDGHWNDTGDEIKIAILPPLWGTLWFQLTGLVVIISLPVAFYIYRIKSIKQEARRLELAVDQRTQALREANDQLAQANRQILHYGEELEETVKQRTKELEIAKSKAEHSDKLKSAFLANMSHEIRTPMNAIVGFLHIIDSKDISDEERQQYGSIIRKSSESLMSLIDDILDLSTIEAGQAEISSQPTNIASLCEELGALFRETLSSQKKGEVKYRHFTEVPEEFDNNPDLAFYIDPHRLKQILWNLLSNALKFTDKGEVALSYKIWKSSSNTSEHSIRFTVRDSGIGIPEEEHSRIFNRFHKIDADQKKLYRGTGLGLAITQTLTHLMHGEIALESAPGVGTTFYITFPFKPVESTTQDAPTQTDLLAASLNVDLSKFSILLVEDEKPNYDYIIRALSKTGVQIEWAQNGKEALEFYQRGTFDLILLDLKIPELDGYQVARRIRKENKNIPIIAQSAYAMASDHVRSIEAGANEHLAKPFRPKQLLETLTRYLLTPKNEP